MKLFLTVERIGTAYTLFQGHETSDKEVKGKPGRKYKVGGTLPSGEDCGSRVVVGQWSIKLHQYSTVEKLTVIEAADYDAFMRLEREYISEKFGVILTRGCSWQGGKGHIVYTIAEPKKERAVKPESDKAASERQARVEAYLAGKPTVHTIDPVLQKEIERDNRIKAAIRAKARRYV